MPVKRALISVSDKNGVLDFARALGELGVELLSNGGTAKLLLEAGLKVTDVSEHTGFPEMMDGRVKTLHPKVHGGLLGRRGTDDQVMQEHGIAPIDLLAVNLYPFEATVARSNVTYGEAIENIDVGGPAMLRAAAKNHAAVTVLVDSADYARVLAQLRATGEVNDALRAELAAKAFAHTAAYDGAIANYLTARDAKGERQRFPATYTAQFHKLYDLRYGENPHQHAAFYAEESPAPGTLAAARQLQGKELSFNNIADADAALNCVLSFDTCACVIVKHANPCGVALGSTPQLAYERAYSVDKESAFGGIIAFNRPLDAATAAKILDNQFVEVIVAPEIEPAALKALSAKPNVRALAVGAAAPPKQVLDYKRVSGGLLLQDADAGSQLPKFEVVTQLAPTPEQMADLAFAWRVVKYVKSNAIVYARGGLSLGIGAGQPSRIMSARIAAIKAGEAKFEVRGSVMASDAFLPFRDSVGVAAHAGVSAIIQPGGSVRDKEVIAAADDSKIAMVFTGMRHFRH